MTHETHVSVKKNKNNRPTCQAFLFPHPFLTSLFPVLSRQAAIAAGRKAPPCARCGRRLLPFCLGAAAAAASIDVDCRSVPPRRRRRLLLSAGVRYVLLLYIHVEVYIYIYLENGVERSHWEKRSSIFVDIFFYIDEPDRVGVVDDAHAKK